MIRYLVTTYASRGNVNLSRPGDWGNLPFPSVKAAKEAAAEDAGGAPFVVDVERAPTRKAPK